MIAETVLSPHQSGLRLEQNSIYNINTSKMSIRIVTTLSLSVVLMSLSSCKKYLETKSVQNLSTPSTLDDLQLMLDNPFVSAIGMNLSNTSTDEYYLKYADWN